MPLHPAFSATVVQLRKQGESASARASNIVGRACTRAISEYATMVISITKIILRCRFIKAYNGRKQQSLVTRLGGGLGQSKSRIENWAVSKRRVELLEGTRYLNSSDAPKARKIRHRQFVRREGA
jgi:hypothetical protein